MPETRTTDASLIYKFTFFHASQGIIAIAFVKHHISIGLLLTIFLNETLKKITLAPALRTFIEICFILFVPKP